MVSNVLPSSLYVYCGPYKLLAEYNRMSFDQALGFYEKLIKDLLLPPLVVTQDIALTQN